MSDKVVPRKERTLRGLILLRGDNFTPIARTPWGGRRIVALKAGLSLGAATRAQEVIGESWEISVGPEFPSELVDGTRLASAIARAPKAMLGVELDRGSTALLVKLLDAAQHLSVQIHPTDDYEGLGDDESGKPEGWVVIARDEGAGVFLGLEEGVTPAHMRDTIERGKDVSKLLHFVPVEVGDCFVIEPGTAHCVGAGVTLVEPQRVMPNKRGVTYRYWDWNRRYNTDGELDPAGVARPLHLEHALAVTDWNQPRGEALVNRMRLAAGAVDLDGPAQSQPLIGPGAPLRSETLGLTRLSGTGEYTLVPTPRLRGLTVVAGRVWSAGQDGGNVVRSGESAVVPASAPEQTLVLERAHALLSWAT